MTLVSGGQYHTKESVITTTVTCWNCKQSLGQFLAADDNGSVIMQCESCHSYNEVCNAAIMEAEEDTAIFADNNTITADPWTE